MFLGRRNIITPRSFVSLVGRSFSENIETTVASAPMLQGVLRQPNRMGSRLSRYLRRDLGQLPGIIYGVDEIFPMTDEERAVKEDAQNKIGHKHKQFRYEARGVRVPVQVDIKAVEKELKRIGRHFESTVYELLLDDNSRHFVIPRQVQINPCKYNMPKFVVYYIILLDIFNYLLLCFVGLSLVCVILVSDAPSAVNFVKVKKVNHLRIPFKFVNQEHSVDLHSRGGYVVRVNRYLDCVAFASEDDEGYPGSNIPAAIEVNVAGCKKGDNIRLDSKHNGVNIITLPKGVVLNTKKCRADMLIGVVKAGK